MSSKDPEDNSPPNQQSSGAAEKLIGDVANALFTNPDDQQEKNEQKEGPNSLNSSQKLSNASDQFISEPKQENEDSQNENEKNNNEDIQDSANLDENNNEAFSSSKGTSTSKKSTGNASSLQPISMKKKAIKKKKAQEPDDPPQQEIDAALDLILHNTPPDEFDPQTLRCCIKQLNQLKKDAVANKNYREANHYAEIIKASQKAADIHGFTTQCAQKLGYLEEMQADAQEKVDEIHNAWVQRFQEFEELIDSKMQALTDSQTKELEEFDKNMPSELPAKYKKHSNEYALMRKKEDLLIKNEDYLAADTIKKKADQLEKEELIKQHMKFQDDLQVERNALIKKHNQQYEAFALWMNTRRHEMLSYRDTDLEGPLKRLEHYTKLVERIKKNGLPPNPLYGYTTNRVSRKESIKAVRTAAQTPMERNTSNRKPRDNLGTSSYRPKSGMTNFSTTPKKNANRNSNSSSQNSGQHSSQDSGRSGSLLPPC